MDNLPSSGLAGAGSANLGATASGGAVTNSAPSNTLTPANMQYNANNANQQAQNVLNQNSSFNPNQFNAMYNPYVNDVVNANTDQSWRNFNQQTMPALTSSFGAQGQFGSGRADQASEQASRDNAQQTNWANSQLMSQGYNDTMKNYQNQQANNIQAAAGLNNAGAQGWSMAQQQYELPYQIAGLNSASIASLRPQSNTSTTSGTTNPFAFG